MTLLGLATKFTPSDTLISNSNTSKLESITLRSFLIGLVCVTALCAVTPYNNHYVADSSYLSNNHLPLGPLFFIIMMCLIFTWQVASAGILRVDTTFDPMMILITTLFLGLIFGEYLIGGMWIIVGLFSGKGYSILPN